MNSIPENYIEEKQFNDRINLFLESLKFIKLCNMPMLIKKEVYR